MRRRTVVATALVVVTALMGPGAEPGAARPSVPPPPETLRGDSNPAVTADDLGTASVTGGVRRVWEIPGSGYGPNDPVVALTFDDGPDPLYTPQVLSVLRQYGAAATFFMLGGSAATYPHLVQAVAAEGHAVANHTWSHVDLRYVSSATFAAEVDRTTALLESLTGQAVVCTRPPYGATNATVEANLAARGQTSVLWSHDTSDWKRPGVSSIVSNALSGLSNGAILLMHDSGGDRSQTVAALPAIIEGIRARGYTLVPICGRPKPPPPLTWLVRGTASPGPADLAVVYGYGGSIPVVGDWNGDGLSDVGVYDDGWWYLRDSMSGGSAEHVVHYGWPGALPVVGDWNRDGRSDLGVYAGGLWLLRDSVSAGPATVALYYGWSGAQPVVGDWDGDGRSDIGVYAAGRWLLRHSATPGPADQVFDYGWAGATPVVGDWDGDVASGVGVYASGWWLLRETTSPGPPERTINYGWGVTTPVVGAWSNGGADGVGVVA